MDDEKALTYILIEIAGSFKHGDETKRAGFAVVNSSTDVPVSNEAIEEICIVEHILEMLDSTNIPIEFAVEMRSRCKHVRHIGDSRGIPVT